MTKVIMKRCPVCRKPFPRNTKSNRGKRIKVRRDIQGIRGVNTVTCSEQCSKVYTDVARHIRRRVRNKQSLRKG